MHTHTFLASAAIMATFLVLNADAFNLPSTGLFKSAAFLTNLNRRIGCANRSCLRVSSCKMSSESKPESSSSVSSIPSAEDSAEIPVRPLAPRTESQMLNAAKQSILKAYADGKNRLKVRFLLPRDGQLLPTDENWPGGIMQLYGACSPLVRRLLQLLAPPQQSAVTREQRLDASGVDGMRSCSTVFARTMSNNKQSGSRIAAKPRACIMTKLIDSSRIAGPLHAIPQLLNPCDHH